MTLYRDREIHPSVKNLPSRGRCKSLTRGRISLSLFKVVVDYFSPTTLNPHNKTLLFSFKSYFKTLSAYKTVPTWVTHDVTSLYDLWCNKVFTQAKLSLPKQVKTTRERQHFLPPQTEFFLYFQSISLIESVTTLRKGQGNPIRVSMICNPRRGLPSRGCRKSWTRGWDSLVPSGV